MIEINQVRALAGGVSASDTPGFPVTIDVGGSYKLTSNLVNSDPNKDTIQITASLVNLDLNGFAILGALGACSWDATVGVHCTSYGTGMAINGTINCPFGNIVRNGTVYQSPNSGVGLCVLSRVEDVQVIGAGNVGIQVNEGSVVSRCQVALAYESGIQAPLSLVADSIVRDACDLGGICFGIDGGSSATVGTRNNVLFRIFRSLYFRNSKTLGSNLCDSGPC